MNSAVLPDLFGNENRRRILRSPSHRPRYVIEISEYLGVSPGATIDHLRELEDAGLIKSRTNDQQRKCFHILRNLRLEMNVSPYGFGAKSVYPPSPSLDIAGYYLHVTLEAKNAGTDDVSELTYELGKLGESDNELPLAQWWVQGHITDALDHLNDHLDVDTDSRFYAEILAALADGSNTVRGIVKEFSVDPAVVGSALHHLTEGGLVAHSGDR